MRGQPKGLIAAALANMGERFGFYTMMAILTLFLMSKFGIDGESALKISSAVGCVRCVIRYSIMARRCKEGFTPKPDRY